MGDLLSLWILLPVYGAAGGGGSRRQAPAAEAQARGNDVKPKRRNTCIGWQMGIAGAFRIADTERHRSTPDDAKAHSGSFP
jgi:hypothetical protein